ncbi:neuropeptide CCHamide-2 [Anabrus simplex]|uniref:neuropeptide CCHamide-2 n=1 Tax=Anabrus simplex TaxID=316456 RepID=UPI0034DDA66F
MAATRAAGPLMMVAVLAIVLATVEFAEAKRGCSAFGHSCFGGHGKRADEDVVLTPGADSEQSRSLYDTAPLNEDDERVLANAIGNLVRPADSVPLRLSPFLRQWLQSYRRPSGQSLEVK